MATFFFFFSEPGVKLDEKSIENGLEGQKFLVVCLLWGGCHHPNNTLAWAMHSSRNSSVSNDKYKGFEGDSVWLKNNLD